MITDDIDEYRTLLEKVDVCGEKLCNEFKKALEPIIPDIDVQLGGIAMGSNCISFDSPSHSYRSDIRKLDDSFVFDNVFSEVFPELYYLVNTDFGMYLSTDEVDKVREALKKLRMGNMSELLPYCDEKMARSISKNISQDEIVELVEVLKFIEAEYPEYGKPSLGATYYDNTEIIAYILIIIPLCGWEEWKKVERAVLDKENLLKGKVGVTCLEGLKE